MNTPLFLLRCVQIGLSLRELDLLTIGIVNDLFIERGNDDCEYKYLIVFNQTEVISWQTASPELR